VSQTNRPSRIEKREHVADRAGRHVDATEAASAGPGPQDAGLGVAPAVDAVVHVPGIPDRSFIEVQNNLLSRIALSRGFDLN
jgi:hypothetical protein